jgi:hypothetical protein
VHFSLRNSQGRSTRSRPPLFYDLSRVDRKRHLDYLIVEFTQYYNTRRSHMERDHLPPVREVPDEVATLNLSEVEVKSYVGGLVKSFERRAA